MNPANDNRPASFDARVMAYMPAMKRMASRLTRDREQRDDLVTDTIIFCLANWEKFREDGGLHNWIYWSMRGVSSNGRRLRRVSLIQDSDGRHMQNLKQMPNQLDALALKEAVIHLNTRTGNALLLYIMGETFNEIAADIGVSPQRAHKMSQEARLALRAAA